MHHLRLGTRGSLLALTQSRWVASELERIAGAQVELQVIRTTGDDIVDRPLSEIGGKGLFTQELDRALMEGDIDFAVHSLKDLPTELHPDLVVAAVPEREDARDALVGPQGTTVSLSTLPDGATVGTSSLRRGALVLAHRPELRVVNIRGNVDTRLRKVDAGEVDALVMAAAGLRRLGLSARISDWLGGGGWLSAPAQGALGVVTRAEDPSVRERVELLGHPPTTAAVTAERALLNSLDGGCQVPVGALAIPFGDSLRLRGVVASPDGRQVVLAEATGSAHDPMGLGRGVAAQLVERGAEEILVAVRGRPSPLASPR